MASPSRCPHFKKAKEPRWNLIFECISQGSPPLSPIFSGPSGGTIPASLTSWDRFFTIIEPIYSELNLEFGTTFLVQQVMSVHDGPSTITFHLGGLALRYIHALLTHTLTGRRESTGVALRDLSHSTLRFTRHTGAVFDTYPSRLVFLSRYLEHDLYEDDRATIWSGPPQYRLVQSDIQHNPKDFTDDVIVEMTGGGVDRSVECTGSIQAMISAFECVQDGWEITVLVGVPNKDDAFKTHPVNLLNEKTLKGTFFGNYKPRSDIPAVVEKYMNKELELDKFITHIVPFSEINKAFELMLAGEGLRCVIRMDE
ncbi:hypothetical protein GOBAR_AA09497 [Gossypium barbadense]|uniref:Alcohol dehydrogenase-like C-terminal domain-containing protein n=1 Tax=Gossypium barbadense TaxID=3634 RepID=A0A2P5Y6D1_GOSBA|nr:hypothetical protein GOBAR_AA09497 [Gossypium barbadense]